MSLLGVSTVVAWWRRALKKAWERSAWGGVAGGNVELDMSNARTLYNGSSQRDTLPRLRALERRIRNTHVTLEGTSSQVIPRNFCGSHSPPTHEIESRALTCSYHTSLRGL